MERDPRKDPQRGDLLYHDGIMVRVMKRWSVNHPRIGFTDGVVHRLSYSPTWKWDNKRNTDIASWRNFPYIKDATLVYVSDKEEDQNDNL